MDNINQIKSKSLSLPTRRQSNTYLPSKASPLPTSFASQILSSSIPSSEVRDVADATLWRCWHLFPPPPPPRPVPAEDVDFFQPFVGDAEEDLHVVEGEMTLSRKPEVSLVALTLRGSSWVALRCAAFPGAGWSPEARTPSFVSEWAKRTPCKVF